MANTIKSNVHIQQNNPFNASKKWSPVFGFAKFSTEEECAIPRSLGTAECVSSKERPNSPLVRTSVQF
jgi:hypothetical protein